MWMGRLSGILMGLVLAGCARGPELPPWRADAVLQALPASCPGGAVAAAAGAPVQPGGISVVNSGGQDVLLVAARGCVFTVDARTGTAEVLPTRGDSIAPTMLDGQSNGIAFSSSLSGSVRVIDTEGAVTFNVSGLEQPLGVRLMPGGITLVAEHGTGRILRLGPADDSRPRLMADKLEGPVGIAVGDATRGYVTESRAGRVSEFRLDRYEVTVVADGLDRPEGIALLADGRLAVAEVGLRRLVAVDPESGDVTLLADNLPISTPADAGDDGTAAITDVATAPDGTLFVSADLDRTVLRVTPRPQQP
jgi:glucose/arabinose dehydrogenase